MDVRDFEIFIRKKSTIVKYQRAHKKYKEGYGQAIKDVCRIIERSHDLYDLQVRLKLPGPGDLLPNLSYHYEEGYMDFIIQIKSEVHRRKKTLEERSYKFPYACKYCKYYTRGGENCELHPYRYRYSSYPAVCDDYTPRERSRDRR